MYNWILTKDANNNVEYIMMVNGKTAVVHRAPYDKALHIVQRGVVSIGNDPEYPISVDGVFMFKGQIEKWEQPKVDEPVPAETESKKKVKKKAAEV